MRFRLFSYWLELREPVRLALFLGSLLGAAGLLALGAVQLATFERPALALVSGIAAIACGFVAIVSLWKRLP